MLRNIGAVVAGIAAWIAVASVLGRLLRAGWPGYSAVEMQFAFTLGMQLARLAIGGAATLAAGAAAAWISRGNRRTVGVLGLLLLVAFLPVHFGIWNKFPVWYHLVFLASLVPLSVLGGRLVKPAAAN